jgi:membrane-bound ClpP family serine protease
MKTMRVTAYSFSVFAACCYLLYPDTGVSLPIALMILTLAFITVAGKSVADGILLSGISTIFIGLAPPERPWTSGIHFYENPRWTLILIGTGLVLLMLALIVHKEREVLRLHKQALQPDNHQQNN